MPASSSCFLHLALLAIAVAATGARIIGTRSKLQQMKRSRDMADPANAPHPCPSLVAEATIRIIKCGHYQATTEQGERTKVILEPRDRLQNAGSRTVTFCTPHVSLPEPSQGAEKSVAPQITLFEGDAFDAAHWLLSTTASTPPPCVLDFASDSEPGGGWKGKQRGTQEEDLCRRSNLGVCLEDHYRRIGGASYMPSFSAVYIPDVLVFRQAKCYCLLPDPFWTSVIAAAMRSTGSDADIQSKMDGILSVAGNHGHRHVVLGAWGCGAFGNDPVKIASHMASAVRRYAGWFDHVVFAIPSSSGSNFQAFHESLPGCEVIFKRSMQESPVETVIPLHLTDQNKWELLTTLPDVITKSIAQAAIDPADYASHNGCRQVAGKLLAALKASCLDALAPTTPAPLLARLHVILPPCSSPGPDASGDLLEVERDIASSFQECSRQLVREVITQRRCSLNLASQRRSSSI